MEDNIRIHLREIGWEGVDWMLRMLAQEKDQWWALVNMVMDLGVPGGGGLLTS
jgi:hypothetical protein